MSDRPLCDTPGCGREIPVGGEGDPEICPKCLREEARRSRAEAHAKATAPIPMRIQCPACGNLHIDEGEFATKPHHTHACQYCGNVWRPALVPTVGVRFLPGFKSEATP